MTGADPARLMAALGYVFRRAELLDEALAHPSAAGPGSPSYERLEFLGDRVLGLAMADILMREFPGENEGDLARRHAVLVSRDLCAKVAADIGLGEYLRMAAGEARAGTGARPSILADACEAVIGAVYQDGGLEAAAMLVGRLWQGLIGREPPPRDAKTALQEWAQARRLPLPTYRVLAEEGPPHQRIFTIEVAVSGYDPARADGASKRVAEQAAAAILLNQVQTRDG